MASDQIEAQAPVLSPSMAQHFHDTLWKLLTNKRSRISDLGICDTLKLPFYYSTDLYETNQWLYAQFRKWPQFSGSVRYPVPCPPNAKVNTFDDAFHALPLWKGEYGASRIQLVMFLLQQLDL